MRNNGTGNDEKQGILDIRAKEALSGEWVDLEVQVEQSDDYRARSKYYLAGMYRDQLEKNNESNYDDLAACYGIHVVLETLFKEEPAAGEWFHHFAMLNTKTFRPLMNHWHLYYIELKKFLKGFQKEPAERKLEQWGYFLGTVQDSTRQLDAFLSDNPAIMEVYDMLRTFTKDDQLRERYRLHEEWLRVQRTEARRKERLLQAYEEEKQAKKAAVMKMEQERQAKEQERQAKEQERQAKEAAQQKSAELQKKSEDLQKKSEELQRRSILSLRKAGYSNEEIAASLGISLAQVESEQSEHGEDLHS